MSASVHPTAIVDASAELGDAVEIGPYCIIGPQVQIGDRSRLVAHVTIERLTHLGPDCVVYPFTALGGPPQDTSYKGEATRLEIGPGNTIREHVTMHRGTVRGKGVTKVGAGGLFMAQTHVAHDCVVGDKVIFSQGAVIGGHVHLGDNVIIGGLAAVHQYCRIGHHAFIGGLAAVVGDLIPYGSAVGNHAHLAGLNVVGLKRRGFSREQIHTLRSAYRQLFAEEGTFQERIEDVAELFPESAEVHEIITFVREVGDRPLVMPND